jgi:hypothetical protein
MALHDLAHNLFIFPQNSCGNIECLTLYTDFFFEITKFIFYVTFYNKFVCIEEPKHHMFFCWPRPSIQNNHMSMCRVI